MRAVCEQARLDRIDQELEMGHAEITVQLDSGDCVYAQGHDNGTGRYFVLSRVSYFMPEQDEEDEDILEEYTTGNRADDGTDSQDPDFIEFLDSWNAEREQMDDAPYTHSLFSPFFGMCENMLDMLLTEVEEENLG